MTTEIDQSITAWLFHIKFAFAVLNNTVDQKAQLMLWQDNKALLHMVKTKFKVQFKDIVKSAQNLFGLGSKCGSREMGRLCIMAQRVLA